MANYSDNLTFTVVSLSTSSDSATALIYNGKYQWFNDDTGLTENKPSGINQRFTSTVSGIGSTINPHISSIIQSGGWLTISMENLSPNTSYTFISETVIDRIVLRFTTSESGSGGSAGGYNPYSGPDGSGPSGNPGPYPIDGTNYSGQTGTQKGMSWASGSNGYFWAKINGTGYKLNTNNISDKNISYNSSHHGSGDYVYIKLEGDCAFSVCSAVSWSVSQISTNGTDWGWWDYNGWPPAYHTSSGDMKDLTAAGNNWDYGKLLGPASGYTNEHAAEPGGRGSVDTTPIARTLSNFNVTYYCKQNLGDGAYGNGAWGGLRGHGSKATIIFTVPRLDPLIKVQSSDTTYGNVYYLIASGVDEHGEYIYDSTHYTSRYLPINTHIKFVCEPTEIGKFVDITPSVPDNLELDITEELVDGLEGITFIANFGLSQLEIKVSKNENIDTVSKSPDGTAVSGSTDWYDVRLHQTITFTATLPARADDYSYKFEGWYINGNQVSTSLVYTATVGTSPLNSSCTVEAVGSKTALDDYYVEDPYYHGTTTIYLSGDRVENQHSVKLGPGESFYLEATANSNYKFVGWLRKKNEQDTWPTEVFNTDVIHNDNAGEYHYFKAIYEVNGAECSILSPDDGLNVISQSLYYDKETNFTEVHTKFIGTIDPNEVTIRNVPYISDAKVAKVGDFFFMVAPKK